MQPTDALTILLRHNLWANLRLLECCAQLTEEQLSASSVGGYGAIRETWLHIVMAEQSYFWRISTGQPYPRSGDALPPTIADMMASLRATGSGLIEWASQIQADDMVQINWDGTPRDVPKTIILAQAVNHATEHRAQIMATLTQLGIEPPELDGWAYFDEQEA